MKRLLPLVALTVALGTATLVPAQEPPEKQLEFVKNLRNKRMSALALQYLEKLKQAPPSELKEILPFEMAETRLSLARERPAAERPKLLEEARQELKAYFKDTAGKPEGARAEVKIALVTVYEGEAFLGQAYRSEDREAKEAYGAKARQRFKDAQAEFTTAIASAEKLLDKYKQAATAEDKAAKARVAEEILKAKFEKAKAVLDEARAILNTSKTAALKEQNDLLEKAKTMLKEVVGDYDKAKADPQTSFLAIAWLIDVYRKQEAGTAETFYDKLMNLDIAEAVPGQQWAMWFRIQGLKSGDFKKVTPDDIVVLLDIQGKRDKLKEIGPEGIQQLAAKATKSGGYIELFADAWLKKYPHLQTTAIGQGMRFELAFAYLTRAQAISKDYKDKTAQPLYAAAQKLFAKIADSDSDLAEKSGQYNFLISVKRMGENTPVANLLTFDDCYLKARFELGRLQELTADLAKAKDDKKRVALAKERRKQFQVIIAAFQRALRLATPQTPNYKVDDVQYFLAYTYLLSGDPYRAAVLGDFLAHRNPPSKRSPLAAGYALQGYARVLNQYSDDVNRFKVRDLANYILKDRKEEWRDELVTPMAHWQQALVLMREKQNEKAIQELELVPKDFSAYTFAQCQLALTALNLRQAASKSGNARQADEYRARALQALSGIPELPKNADPATALMFFVAQLEHGKLLYEDAATSLRDGQLEAAGDKYRALVKLSDGLLKQFAHVKADIDPAERREQVGAALQTLAKYGRVGVGEIEYRAGNYDKVLSKELAGAIVDQVKALAKGKDNITLNDYEVAGEALGLALRVHVQKGELKEATEMLGLVRRLEGPGRQAADATVVLGKLINDLRAQVKDLTARKDQDKLKTTVKNFGAFFDTLLETEGGKDVNRYTLFFLAQSFATLNQHEKAAALYGKLKKSSAADLAVVKLTRDEEAKMALLSAQAKAVFLKTKQKSQQQKDEQVWWMAQVFRAKELRLAKRIDEADKLLDKALEANVVRLLAKKEKIHVLEDRGLWGRAIGEWSKLMASEPVQRPLKANDKDMRKFYFECYYQHVFAYYNYSQTTGKADEQKYLKKAADRILALERVKSQEGWRAIQPQIQELLRDAPKLDRVYQKLKKGTD